MARLVLHDLSKIFKLPGGREIRAVEGINLEVADGESVVLLGPSGSGKTVTLRLIAGLEEPSGGTITIGDRAVNGVSAKDRDVAMVFQSHALYPHMTAAENLGFGLKVRKVSKAERERRVLETAGMLGIVECLGSRPSELSGGQRQRVALGRALVRQPALFLFDEPFSNLDAPMRAQLRADFLRLQKQLGWTSVYVTHDQTEAMALGDKLAVIQEGNICQVGTPLDVYARPADRFVAGFIGTLPMNFVPGRLLGGKGAPVFQTNGAENLELRCPLQGPRWEHLKSLAERGAVLGIRPENMRLVPAAAAAGALGAGWKARVEVVQTLGAESYVQVRCGAHLLGVRGGTWETISRNEEVWVAFAPEAAHLFDPESGMAL